MLDALCQQSEEFRADVLRGLAQPQKTLPCRWLYDDRGSELFEEITQLPEYYPTRTETSILREHAEDMAAFCGPDVVLFEYGAGAGIKTEILVSELRSPRLYVPIDIAGDFLELTAARFREKFPQLAIQPIVSDFTADFPWPPSLPPGPRVAFFPGSTIGNLNAAEAASFLRRMRRHTSTAIIGVDLQKPLDILLPAYDDPTGVTAQFNLNLLTRINRELGANFVIEAFQHQARWNDAESAIEMHLLSRCTQSVSLAGRSFDFAAGETIHTESSRKYSLERFAGLAGDNGWDVAKLWTDPRGLFAVFGLR